MKEVAVYSTGVLVGGQPRTWADLKQVLFDEASRELRFYDESIDYGGDFSIKYLDVLQIPIAEGQRREARRVVESLARKGASDWSPPPG